MAELGRKLYELSLPSETPIYIVLDNARRLFELGPHLVPAFFSLHQATLRRLCIVLISSGWLPVDQHAAGLQPVTVHFTAYDRNAAIAIVADKGEARAHSFTH